ncbi:hypothetical protein GCM10010411_49020 [Actinomadura fulvescens]|uniref:Uncharacterized protein n=1 Tax=Actinomadura fulvescens TaxID=46160 RepID=A0ABN3PYT7_9ACTN
MPRPADLWLRVNAALSDTRALTSEIRRLHAEASNARRRYANLVAAVRVTFSAQRDAEADPLYYLRDKLRAQGKLPPHGAGSA